MGTNQYNNRLLAKVKKVTERDENKNRTGSWWGMRVYEKDRDKDR